MFKFYRSERLFQQKSLLPNLYIIEFQKLVLTPFFQLYFQQVKYKQLSITKFEANFFYEIKKNLYKNKINVLELGITYHANLNQ